MKRTTAEANVANLYDEGNPSLGQPATVVGAEEMNQIQEEIANAIELAGIALSVADDEQLNKAILARIAAGGTQIQQTLDNNASAVVITGLVFDKALVKGARVLIDLFRRDDGPQDKNEIGELFVSHNTEQDTWSINHISHGDDTETTFAISVAGQVSYSSSTYAGANYAGTMKVGFINELSQ
jgi:hypothetical protein